MAIKKIKNMNLNELEKEELKDIVIFLMNDAEKIETLREEVRGRWGTEMVSVHRINQILKTYEEKNEFIKRKIV